MDQVLFVCLVFFKSLLYFKLCMCVCLWLCVRVSVDAHRGQTFDPLELKRKVLVSPLTWVLRIDVGSSLRTVHTLNY